MLDGLVGGQQDHEDEVGGVPGCGEGTASLARLVEGALVAKSLQVYIVLRGRLQPDDGHVVTQDLRVLFSQNTPEDEIS